MAPPKVIDRKNDPKRAIPALTLGIFVRSAGLANLLAATLVFIEFSAVAIVKNDGKTFELGLSAIPLLTFVIWGTAAVLIVVALTSKWLWLLGRRMTSTSRPSEPGRSGVWDHWLDSPEPHEP
jgi:hypothetical protein